MKCERCEGVGDVRKVLVSVLEPGAEAGYMQELAEMFLCSECRHLLGVWLDDKFLSE